MSKSWLDDIVKILQLISLPIVITVAVYANSRDYLTDFWKGFVIGALVIFFLMLVINVYLYWAGKSKQELRSQGQGEAYPCSKCGNPFYATKYDDTHTIASRTKGEYQDQIPISYKCQKCKTQNMIYWSAPSFHTAIVGVSRQH